MLMKKSQLITRPSKRRPHVVILGAGASVAAFPSGDANGKKLPTMDNFVEILDLEPILKRSGIEYENCNFEDIYSRLYESDSKSPLLKEVEEIVYNYFSSLQLPDIPTLYDHILLSLRPKDIVATFNWDPFLFDAWNRNKDSVLFLILFISMATFVSLIAWSIHVMVSTEWFAQNVIVSLYRLGYSTPLQ